MKTVAGEGLATTQPASSWLSRERTVAGPRYNRWLAPPAALAIHLCIGMAYGFSVFWLPTSHLLPGPVPASCAHQSFFAELFSTSCNWSVPSLTNVFETFIGVLGVAAAIWGGWLEHAGPRKAGVISAVCWGGGLFLGGIGVAFHQLWMLYLFCGLLGGIGQGLGYITPVSTLLKWFPDRRGMATGFAIMGYGGGAMVGAPLAVWLMGRFGHAGIAGVAPAMMVMGGLYFIIMTAGAVGFRVPPSGWLPSGWTPPENRDRAMVAIGHVHVSKAWKTPQFWLIWGVLVLNVTAGISVISMASPMLQDVFGGSLVGVLPGSPLNAAQKAAVVAAAAGLVGLISLFNSLGRIFWASLSDKLGRKAVYTIIFILGICLYSLLPTWGHMRIPIAFVASVCIIISMYGGGFATVPAYLADIFGTQMVGAIHGRLITAWSAAGVVGPALIAGIRQFQLERGVPHDRVYDGTLYFMAALLCCGFLCNLLIRPVHSKYLMTDEELLKERALQREDRIDASAATSARGRFGIAGVAAWIAVGIPFCIGLVIALQKAIALF